MWFPLSINSEFILKTNAQLTCDQTLCCGNHLWKEQDRYWGQWGRRHHTDRLPGSKAGKAGWHPKTLRQQEGTEQVWGAEGSLWEPA